MKKIFSIIVMCVALICCFTGCGKVKDIKTERFEVTNVEFSDLWSDTVWDGDKRSSAIIVETTQGIMVIPETSTTVGVAAEGEEGYLEVITKTISTLWKDKEKVTYIIYLPEEYFFGYEE